MIETILARLDDLEYLAATLKTRLGNVVRTGVVKSYDAAKNGVVANLGDDDATFLTHTVPVFTHAGSGKDWRPMKAGQQVTLISADGDLSNAVALPGGFHDQNGAPSTQASEDIVMARGDVRARATDTLIEHVADKNSKVTVQQDGWVTATVKGTVRFVIYDSAAKVYYTIDPAALIPTSPPPSSS